MICQELVGFLTDYLDGNLSAEERARFEEHLGRCPDCVNYLATYQTAIRLAKTSFSEGFEAILAEVPRELNQAIEAELIRKKS